MPSPKRAMSFRFRCQMLLAVGVGVTWGLCTALDLNTKIDLAAFLILIGLVAVVLALEFYWTKRCPKCQDPDHVGPNFCGYCGHKLNDDKIEA